METDSKFLNLNQRYPNPSSQTANPTSEPVSWITLLYIVCQSSKHFFRPLKFYNWSYRSKVKSAVLIIILFFRLPPTGATSVPPTERVIVREYEPAPINRLREEKRESIIRSNLHAFFTSMDSQLKALYPPNKFTWPDQKPTGLANRWKFHDSASEEPPAKKQKSDRDESSSSVLPPPPSPELAEGDLCVICMEKARTHAFLHYGLADQDVTSHFVACQDCANSCRWADQGCPCCRKPCINVIRVLKWTYFF